MDWHRVERGPHDDPAARGLFHHDGTPTTADVNHDFAPYSCRHHYRCTLTVFYALPLLAQSSGDFEILVLVLAGPFLLAYSPCESTDLALWARHLRAVAVLVQPSNTFHLR